MASDSASPILETLGLFAIVFVLQVIAAMFSLGLMAGLFVLAPPLESNPWTILTSVYAHGGVGHLVSNSIGLIVFGWPIARATTRLRFHTFFVLTGAIAGISQILVTSAIGPATSVLGASGAVFALMGYLIAGNRVSDSVAARVEIPLWATLLAFVVLAAVITVATGAPGIALVAHFTGFLLGLVTGRLGVLEVSRAAERTRAMA
ncbi:rhomboid family intramembrane serine protease [Saliphagus sp. GCM10025317]